VLQRFAGSPRLYSWLIVTGLVVAVMPVPITLLTRSKAGYHEAQVAQAVAQVGWLRAAVTTAITPADSAAIETEVTRVEKIEAAAQRRLDRQRRRLARMWRPNGGGPLLVAAGALITYLGHRLRRFELYGE